MESSRRAAAGYEVGVTTQNEYQEIERAKQREENRQAVKDQKKRHLQRKASYRMMESTAKWMDKYYLDGIIGLLPGGIGDILSTALALPFIYFSAIHVRSIPLTLAVIYNILVDMMLGLIPFFIGDIIDFFNKAYVQNIKMITGFVEDDKAVISEVNSKAVKTSILIAIVCVIIYFLVKMVIWIAEGIGSAFDYVGSLF